MWLKAGSRYFNTDCVAYIQVTAEEGSENPKAVYIHFVDESHTFTLHGDEARVVQLALESSVTDTVRALVKSG